jgi:hypothetical protein
LQLVLVSDRHMYHRVERPRGAGRRHDTRYRSDVLPEHPTGSGVSLDEEVRACHR